MKLAVFAYNFPHKRTQDFLVRLYLEGYDIELVVAADRLELSLPRETLRVKPRHVDLVHPETVCRRLGIPYHVLPHNSGETAEMMRSNGIDVGIVAGARILKKPTIDSVTKGIINFHPGLIPEVRGLDAVKWAVYRDLPIGLTVHFIDERVDAGRTILTREIPLRADDTLVDISLRLAETQANLLPEVLELIRDKSAVDFPLIPAVGRANPPMPSELEREVPGRLVERLSRVG